MDHGHCPSKQVLVIITVLTQPPFPPHPLDEFNYGIAVIYDTSTFDTSTSIPTTINGYVGQTTSQVGHLHHTPLLSTPSPKLHPPSRHHRRPTELPKTHTPIGDIESGF